MSNVSPSLPRWLGSILWRLPDIDQTQSRPRAVIVGHQHPRSEQSCGQVLLLRMRSGLALD